MCKTRCAENWPALMASADAKAEASGRWTVLARDDGKMMWAYKGKPLYTWKKDSAPGDTTGDGFNNGVCDTATRCSAQNGSDGIERAPVCAILKLPTGALRAAIATKTPARTAPGSSDELHH